MSFQFNESFYLTNNPDVFLAVATGQMGSGLAHYNQFGWVEGRDPNANFDTSYYVAENPDVAAAVLAGLFESPLQHFQLYGAAEGRAPSAAAAELLGYWDEAAYLAANPDVGQAIADGHFQNALQHYQLYGQFENRPGVPELPPVDGKFTLTTGTDAGPDFTGGDGDDVFNAELQQTGLLPIQTLNNSDDLDGGEGRNTLNAQLANLFTVPVGLNNIQVLNLEGNPGFLGILPLVTTLDVINANAIDEINFRTPTTGTTVNNLQTGLDTVGIYDDGSPLFGGNLFTINHIGDATDGDADVLDVNVRNAAIGSSLLLTHAGGGADQGYEEVNLHSMGPLANILTVASTHGPGTLVIDGTADLTLVNTGGLGAGSLDILNVSVLDEVDATLLSGDLTATFTGTGDVTVDSGSGDDALSFFTTGNVEVHGNAGDDYLLFGNGVVATATGGDGDDTFEFLANGNGTSSFTSADSVDGNDGDNELILWQTAGGNLFNAGVGSNIAGIDTIIHRGDVAFLGGPIFTVDMALSGSASILRLEGEYDLGLVTNVTNLTNDDLVVLDAFFQPTSNLNLSYAAPSALNIINLELAGGQTVAVLNTQALTEIVNLTSSGTTANAISDASGIEGNLVIDGDANLTVGTSPANGYDYDNGVVDTTAATGNVAVWVEGGNQTILDGAGNNFYTLSLAGAANVDEVFLDGGIDTVLVRNANTALDGGLINGTQLHNIHGFDVSGDEADVLGVWLSGLGIATVVETDGTTVLAGDDLLVRNVVEGEVSNLSASDFNFLKFTTAVSGATSAEGLFQAAIGAGSLTVAAGGGNLIGAAYDLDLEQMVVFVIDGPGGFVTSGDDIDGIATLSMSYDDFLAFDAGNFGFFA